MIFGKRHERHPLEPIERPIRLNVPYETPSLGNNLPDAMLEEARRTLAEGRSFAPHCDQRILHAPGLCWACDLYPDWQALRVKWGIAFTGSPPTDSQLPCPADYHRPPGSTSDHRRWGPNQAQGDLRG